MKKVLLAFLSVFFLLGGVVLSACNEQKPQAVINVTSSDFVSEDYIEIDLTSDKPYAQITAKVENVSYGQVVANTDSQSILTPSAKFDANSNSTLITIYGESEGRGVVELKSTEGSASKIINVFVYSNILGLEQKDSSSNKDQFVLRGKANLLDPNKYLNFTSRPNGESNRKDVIWEFAENQSQLDLTLVDNILTVDDGYAGQTIELVARSVYTDLFANVSLKVVDQFNAPNLTFSRDGLAGYETYEKPFNLIKNDETQEDSKLYVKLDFGGLDQTQLSTTWVVYLNGKIVSDVLDITLQGNDTYGNPYYKIVAKSADLDISTLTIKFTVAYKDINYSQVTEPFDVTLADVVDRISVTSNGEKVSQESEFDVYNNYSSDMPYGRPFQVVLGPNTVAGATFKITSNGNLGELFVVYYQTSGSGVTLVEFNENDGVFESENIPNNAIVYFKAKAGSNESASVNFVSTQSDSVRVDFSLVTKEAPNGDFNITSETSFFLSTLNIGNVVSEVELSTTTSGAIDVSQIYDGLFYEIENLTGEAKVDVKLELIGGEVVITVSNKVQNFTEDYKIRLCHESGFKSTNTIDVSAFTPLTYASIGLIGSDSNSVVEKGNGYQPNETGDFTLTKLVMRSSNSVSLNVATNNGATKRAEFKTFSFYEIISDELSISSYEELLGAIQNGNLEKSDAVTFDFSTGRLTTTEDVRGYVLFEFLGYNDRHNTVSLQRWFYLEGYTGPTSLRANPENVSLVARDSVSLNDYINLSTANIEVRYRLDNIGITYFDVSKFKFSSSVKEYAVLQGDGANFNYKIENVSVTATELRFDIVALTTYDKSVFNDTLLIEYSDFGNLAYFEEIDVTITSAVRVQNLVWENETENGEIHLELFSANESDKQFTIVTSVSPLNAYNKDLTYIFAPSEGTPANLIEIDELGIVGFNKSLGEGGTGTIFVLPTDAIRLIGGTEYITFYQDDQDEAKQVALSELYNNYESVSNGYFFVGDGEKVYYRDVVLSIPVVVADGRSEATATRIYTAEQFKNIDENLHYVLMNSISLEDYENNGKDFAGSLKGYDENVAIYLSGESLFNTITEAGKVSQLTIYGEVTGGGFVANENNGEISNVVLTTQNSGETISMSQVSGGYTVATNVFAGSIVGINNKTIKDVKIEGVNVDLSSADSETNTSYAGTFVGKNSGTIENVYGEFYIFEGGTDGIINKITAEIVGGFVGYGTGGSSVTHSYVYNYSASWNDEGALTFEKECLIGDAGAFVGKSDNSTITNSFSMVTTTSDFTCIEGTLSSSSNNYYYGTTSVSTSNFDSEYWLQAGDEGFNKNVRNGYPHLKFYQAEALANLNGVAVQKTSKSLPVDDGAKGVLFFYKLKNTANLSDASMTALTRLNTISVKELFGEENIIVVTENDQIAEIVGNNIVIKGIGDVKLTVHNKHDYTQSKDFEFKVVYVLEDFSGLHNGVATSGFDLQEGKSDYIEFRFKESVYLANEAQPRAIYLPDFSLQGEIDSSETIHELVSYSINGMVGQVSFEKGIKNALEGSQYVSIKTSVIINNLDESFASAVKEEFTNTMSVRPFLGADEIFVEFDNVRIEPSVTSKIDVELITDSDEDALILQIARSLAGGDTLLSFADGGNSFEIDNDSKTTTAKFVEDVLDISVSRSAFDSLNSKYIYTITLKIDENYRSKIESDENYTLILKSKSGTAKNEPQKVGLTLSSQQINFVDVSNYRASNVNNVNGQIVYTRTDEQVSVVSPGRASFMSIVVDPSYAYYHHMTLTYQAVDAVTQQPSNATLTITKLKNYKNYDKQYLVDSGAVTNVVGGVQVARNENGTYDFRLYASQNISSDVIFVLKASFFDSNNVQIGQSTVYQLYVTYLPEAEIMVDGQVSTILAKGGTAELSIRLRQDQNIDYLTAVGAVGITIAPQSSWKETQNADGTKTLTAMLYASLNAGVGTASKNGTFEIQASVVRQLNGVEERKNSNAYVTIVDIKPTSAKLNGAVYDEASNTYVFTSWVGITHGLMFDYNFDPEKYSYDESDSTESQLVQKLNEARAGFENDGYYKDDASGFSINYKQGRAVPIYERLEMNGTRLTFIEDKDGNYTYSNGRFRLTYTNGVLSVTGIATTSSPIYLTLVDEIRIDSEGDALYQIETNFAVNVTIYSDLDRPLIIQSAEDFLQVADEGVAQDYILLNDITLENYTPLSSANFRSLDGNGYSINIKSFNLQGSGTLQLGLFSTVTENSTIKNVRVNYYQTQIAVDVTSSGYSNISIGGFAVVNNGTITNCQVVSYNPNGEDATNLGLKVDYFKGATPYYIDANSNIESRVAGFVVENSGSITNSKVGGEDIILIGKQVGETNYFDYSVRELELFELSAQGNVAGFVISNAGEIASCGATNVQITNLSSSDKSQTAGFVVSNSGKIRASGIQGITGEDDLVEGYALYHRTGSSITSKGIVAGFVVENSQNGEISDGYSNILISNSKVENSIVGAGFVYINEGRIETSYTASTVESNNARQLNFSGVDSVGNSLNTGTIELSYYYTVNQEFDSSGDVQSALNEANLINKEEVGNQNAYYGFVFNTEEGVDDGVWKMVDGYGIEPISLTKMTISHRYYVASETDEEYFLPYSTLKNQDDSLAQVYDTSYGEEINPILINSAQDLKEAMGDSTSTALSSQFTETEILGAYRFTTDIDLSELNNALGNAEIKSVNKTFKGVIDGNGFTINNISLSSDEKAVGLFGSADGALIQNLNIEIDSVAAGSSVMVGGLVGFAKDTKIINVNMTQSETTEQTQQRGIYGRNVTGGIVGASIGDGALIGLTVSGATVQSNYYNVNTNVSSSELYSHSDWSFDPAKIRDYARQNDAKIYSASPVDDGFGLASFAGAIAGYVDIYNYSLHNQTNYTYSTALTNVDYKVSHLRVLNSLEVRGEVVGGAFGYTGIQTKVQDAGVYVSHGENITAKILSYNFIAGGLVGIANGDFYQVFTQHDEQLQDEIENSMASYYINGNVNAERGVLDLFENTSTSTDAYQPLYVGGLFGVFGNGSVYVAYSKLNAINPNSSSNGYAGGLAGGAFSVEGTDFVVEDGANSSMISTTMILREVYATGDVFANGANTGNVATNFGGLFGRFIPYGETKNSCVKLTMAAVNSFNEYGILGENYQSTSTNKIVTINSLVGESNNVKPVVSQVLSTTENSDNKKSYGYMGNYSSGVVSVDVESGVYKENSESDDKKDADFVFEVQSLSTFANPESGYMVTNGAFINSNAWDIANWIHTTDKLFPSINLTSSPTYVYLDQDNVKEVLDKMQNSSIEVRVRGRGINGNGDVYYAYVDLTGITTSESAYVSNFFGRLIGASDSAWFTESAGGSTNPYKLESLDYDSTQALNNSYPGIIINKAMFEQVGSGVIFQNLNVVVLETEISTANGGTTTTPISSPFITNSIEDVDFVNVRFWFVDKVELDVKTNAGGLIAPSAENCNFIGITMCFSYEPVGTEGAIVTFNYSGESISAGLLVGELVQSSNFESLRVQNITIKHNDLIYKNKSSYLLKISGGGTSSSEANIYAGLYVGIIKNTLEDDKITPSGVSISAKLPQNITSQFPEGGDGTNTVFDSGISVNGTTNNYKSVYVGGLFGKIETISTTFTLQKQTSYSQSVKVNINVGTEVGTEEGGGTFAGGVVGSFNGEFNVVADGENAQIGSDIVLDKDHSELSAGMIFGGVATGSRIDISTNKQLKIEGYISVNDNDTATNKTATITTANIGGIVGKNQGVLNISNVDISFKTFKGNTPGEISEKDFEASDVANSLFKAETINAGALVGLNKSGIITIEGKDDSTAPDTASFKINTAQENILLNATTINAGGLIGETTGSGVVSISNYINNQAVIVAVGNADSDSTSVGGMIGLGQVEMSENETSSDKTLIKIESSASDVNIFVSEKTLYAGGLIGKLTTTATNSGTTSPATAEVSISQNVFSGAIKVYGETSNQGDHIIGGILGLIEKDTGNTNIKTTISSNKTYGDVIYTTEATVTTGKATTTEEATFNSLVSYYFGGVVGYVNAGSTTLSGNIVAFTNNNQLRGKELHFADAMVGSVGKDVSLDVNNNYYSSQLVLATSDNAIDLNYKTEGVSGYSPNDATTTTPDATIIDKLTATDSGTPSVVAGDLGTKLKPITDGTATTYSSNGITYYTTQYPGTQTGPYAFIGDWVEKNDTLTTLNEHSFISGVNTALEYEDTYKDTASGDNPKDVKNGDTNRGGIVDTMNGGIVYACISSGTLSVGGTVTANVGGIVGSMASGYINECSSSLNVTYRAGNGGTASAVAVVLTGNTKKIFINNTYTSGNVTSYIDANLFAFVNGTTSTSISNSYTISRVGWNDYTSSNTAPASTITIGISGSSVKAGFSYDPDAMGDAYGKEVKEDETETQIKSSDWIYPAYYDKIGKSVGSIDISGWSKDASVNYGYPVRNFGAFKAYTTRETVDGITYDLIPNITKLKQASDTNIENSTNIPKINYKLVNDIDLAKTTYSSSLNGNINFKSVPNFDGDGHTISNLKVYTLFSEVQNISNLRVMDAVLGVVDDELKINKDVLSNQRAVVALEVTGEAENVIASGTLSYSASSITDKYIGGVFAHASDNGVIDGCKNYVKMDVTCDGIDIGGVVGKSIGKSIKNCFNYAPINAVNKNAGGGGGYVAGVVGSWEASDGKVENCGNENTVFNGYTNTANSDEIEDGNYSAAGIVGWANNSNGSITNCYNTSMIKAGKKEINKTKTSGSCKAAGIVAYTTGSVSYCTNTGFIEALGSTSEAITQFKINTPWSEYTDAGKPLKDTWANDSSSTTTSQGYIYKLNATDIKNVYVSQIALNNSLVEIGSSCSATGSVYKNGLFGSVKDSVELTPPSYEPGLIGTEGNTTAKELSLHSGDIKIYFADDDASKPTPVIAETDELGMMTKFYIKSTRTIKYNNDDNLVRTQTRYWSVVDINGLHKEGTTYQTNKNYYAQQATQSQGYAGTGYTEPSTNSTSSSTTTSSSGNIQNVMIAGNAYAFVEDADGFKNVAQSGMKLGEVELSVNTKLGDNTIKELINAGYTFSIVEIKNNGNEITSEVNVNIKNDNNYLYIDFSTYSNITTISSYKLVANKANASSTIYISSDSNIKINGETIEIETNLSEIEKDEKYQISFQNGETTQYLVMTGLEQQKLTYTAKDESAAQELYKSLLGKSIKINLGYNSSEQVSMVYSDLVEISTYNTFKYSKDVTKEFVSNINLVSSIWASRDYIYNNAKIAHQTQFTSVENLKYQGQFGFKTDGFSDFSFYNTKIFSELSELSKGKTGSITLTWPDAEEDTCQFTYKISELTGNYCTVDITIQLNENSNFSKAIAIDLVVFAVNYKDTISFEENVAYDVNNVKSDYKKGTLDSDLTEESEVTPISGLTASYTVTKKTQRYYLNYVEIKTESVDKDVIGFVYESQTKYLFGAETLKFNNQTTGDMVLDKITIKRKGSVNLGIEDHLMPEETTAVVELKTQDFALIDSSSISTNVLEGFSFEIDKINYVFKKTDEGTIINLLTNETLQNNEIVINGTTYSLSWENENIPVLNNGDEKLTGITGYVYEFNISSNDYFVYIGQNDQVVTSSSITMINNTELIFSIEDENYIILDDTINIIYLGSNGSLQLGEKTIYYLANNNLIGFLLFDEAGNPLSTTDDYILQVDGKDYLCYNIEKNTIINNAATIEKGQIQFSISDSIDTMDVANGYLTIAFGKREEIYQTFMVTGSAQVDFNSHFSYLEFIDKIILSSTKEGAASISGDNVTINNTNYVLSIDGDKALLTNDLSEIEGTYDGIIAQFNIGDSTFSFNYQEFNTSGNAPIQDSGSYTFVAKYKEFEKSSNSSVNLTSNTSINADIVVTKDINLGMTDQLLVNSSIKRITSVNHNFINFYRDGNSLLGSKNSDNFVDVELKNIAFAGTVVISSSNTGLLADNIRGNLINISTYGTICHAKTSSSKDILSGGVAYQINSTYMSIKDFTSYSHDSSNIDRSNNNSTGNMAGVAWSVDLGSNATVDITYYGTIIGTNGSHGTTYDHDRNKDGGEGQGVFALARKITSAPTGFTFKGIIKSGDGGSGSRGLDGKGGKDSVDGSAPYNGTYGSNAGGEAGSAGGAYSYQINSTETNPTSPISITGSYKIDNIASSAGSRGNYGWGGVNLSKYSYDKEDPDGNATGADANPKTYYTFQNVYGNGGTTYSYSQNYNPVWVYVRVRKVRSTEETSRAEIELETSGDTEWVNITFTKNDYSNTAIYDTCGSDYNEKTGHGIIFISRKTEIQRFKGTNLIAWFRIKRIQVDVYRYDACTSAVLINKDGKQYVWDQEKNQYIWGKVA